MKISFSCTCNILYSLLHVHGRMKSIIHMHASVHSHNILRYGTHHTLYASTYRKAQQPEHYMHRCIHDRGEALSSRVVVIGRRPAALTYDTCHPQCFPSIKKQQYTVDLTFAAYQITPGTKVNMSMGKGLFIVVLT